MKAAMERTKIVPDVVSTAPEDMLNIHYKSGAVVSMGNELTPTQVKNQPDVGWKDADENSLYTLAMVDPDAPSREAPKMREWHHWLVVNIPGADVAQGETMSEYIGAAPPKGSGLHRYVFLLYKQLGKLKCSEPKLTNKSGEKRGKFSIAQFAKKYNLDGPIAGNFFEAKFDDYCTVIQKQLSKK
ncbi:protein D3-like [Cimex lectularius]|uniref:Phosphatidylethanolamine binding protein n=1 Tax=Cimex lectularius TaxID=79782 RepID=A0A8I6S8Q1_CIMLE|nr:protein D3-like [Cimex lectularius]